MAAFFQYFVTRFSQVLTFYIETPFWTEGVQRGAKAIAEVRKPGGHGKVASVLFFFQLENSYG